MICEKCGTGLLVDDSHHDIKVLKCVSCGDRIYAGHPKRWGALVCCRCGDDLDEANELSLCQGCQRALGIPARSLKKRICGETTCPVRRNVQKEKAHAGISFHTAQEQDASPSCGG